MHTKAPSPSLTFIAVALPVVALVGFASVAALVATSHTVTPPPAQYTLTARPWDSTNVYVLDHGLSAEDCAHDLETFAPDISPMVELEPGNWIDREAVQMACGLDGDI